jgi:hypothetical protein
LAVVSRRLAALETGSRPAPQPHHPQPPSPTGRAYYETCPGSADIEEADAVVSAGRAAAPVRKKSRCPHRSAQHVAPLVPKFAERYRT